jgi:beta-1,4-N-acetylglucosaminyltransferase
VILVTVGTHTDPFLRLVEGMDRAAAWLDEEVIIQAGVTAYRPQAAMVFAFTSQDNMEALYSQARLIISHAGAGAILIALRLGKPLIVMPRLRKYGEHANDHQVELSRALAARGAVLLVDEPGELVAAIAAAASFAPAAGRGEPLVDALRRVAQEPVRA